MTMERFIKVTTSDNISIVSIRGIDTIDLGNDVKVEKFDRFFNKFVHLELDCEIYDMVSLSCLQDIFIIVDDNGYFNNKSINRFASLLYSTTFPVLGDVLFVSERRVGSLGERDVCGLSQYQIDMITRLFNIFLHNKEI